MVPPTALQRGKNIACADKQIADGELKQGTGGREAHEEEAVARGKGRCAFQEASDGVVEEGTEESSITPEHRCRRREEGLRRTFCNEEPGEERRRVVRPAAAPDVGREEAAPPARPGTGKEVALVLHAREHLADHVLRKRHRRRQIDRGKHTPCDRICWM